MKKIVMIYIHSGFVSRISSNDPDNIDVVVVDTDTEVDVEETSSFNLKRVDDKLAYVETFEPDPVSNLDYEWLNASYIEDEFADFDLEEPNQTGKLND